MTTRIYLVENGETSMLVEASNKNQALAYVARTRYKVRVASQQDLVRAISNGKKVEKLAEAEETQDA